MKIRTIIFFIIISFQSLVSCNNEVQVKNNSEPAKQSETTVKVEETKLLPYEILNKEKTESNNKALLKLNVFLTKGFSKKEELENTIATIYSENKNEGGYKNFKTPTVVAIYMYTSKSLATEMPDQWIAMLIKRPNENQPYISIDDYKVNSQSQLKDGQESKDEIELRKLTALLQKKGLELCSFYKRIRDIETLSIKKADIKYPNFGNKHIEYSDMLIEKEMDKLKTNYKLNDKDLLAVSIYAYSYCK